MADTSVTVSAEHVRHSSNCNNQLLLETLSNTFESGKYKTIFHK